MKSQTFGERLRELRVNNNFTLKFVGAKLKFSPKLLSKIEKNEKKAPESIIRGLAKIYQTTYKELITKYLSEEIYYQVRNFEHSEEVLNIVKNRLRKEGKGTQIERSRDKIFQSIKSYFSDKPVKKAWIFGSFARNTTVSKDSDIDILIVFKKPHKITLFDLIQMKEELSSKTGRGIDLVEEGQELKSLTNSIQKEKVLVYAS